MKKIFFLLALLLALGNYQTLFGKTVPKVSDEIKTRNREKDKGEKLFIRHSDQCLTIIERAAQKMSIQGVTIIAYIPGEVTSTWISKMKVVGSLTNSDSNLLAIASCKAAEMTDTFKDSGSGLRKPLKGENGYKGGIIKKVNSGYILAVFSGGSGDQDVAAAKEGLDWLLQYYPQSK